MGKTKEQVNRYLTHCKFPDEDWKRILSYCRENGYGNAHKAAHPKSESTFNQFINWLENGFGAGDVVRYGHTVGLLSTCTPDYTVICARFSRNNDLIIADVQVSADKLMPPVDNDTEIMYAGLKRRGYCFDKRLCVIYENLLPAPYSRVCYRINGVDGYGVVSGYDGSLVRFVFGVRCGILRRDFAEEMCNVDLDDITREGIKEMDAVLADNCLYWDHNTRSLEFLQKRVRAGESYWYITDKFTVSSAKENHTPTNEARYKRGNYFIRHSDALDFLIRIQQMRKEERK